MATSFGLVSRQPRAREREIEKESFDTRPREMDTKRHM